MFNFSVSWMKNIESKTHFNCINHWKIEFLFKPKLVDTLSLNHFEDIKHPRRIHKSLLSLLCGHKKSLNYPKVCYVKIMQHFVQALHNFCSCKLQQRTKAKVLVLSPIKLSQRVKILLIISIKYSSISYITTIHFNHISKNRFLVHFGTVWPKIRRTISPKPGMQST